MSRNKKGMYIQIAAKTHAELKELAKEKNTSIRELAETAFHELLKKVKKKHRSNASYVFENLSKYSFDLPPEDRDLSNRIDEIVYQTEK